MIEGEEMTPGEMIQLRGELRQKKTRAGEWKKLWEPHCFKGAYHNVEESQKVHFLLLPSTSPFPDFVVSTTNPRHQEFTCKQDVRDCSTRQLRSEGVPLKGLIQANGSLFPLQ